MLRIGENRLGGKSVSVVGRADVHYAHLDALNAALRVAQRSRRERCWASSGTQAMSEGRRRTFTLRCTDGAAR